MGFQAVTGEALIREATVNYQRGWEAVNGVLQLTTHRLFFESNRLNISKGAIGIDLREIASVAPDWTKLLGLIPLVANSIAVRTTTGETYKFVVMGRGSWIRAIEAERQKQSARPAHIGVAQ